MSKDPKAAKEAAESVMLKIAREVEAPRGLIFITFTHNQFEQRPDGYFNPLEAPTLDPPIRFDLPVPRAVPLEAVRPFVAAIIRDGYEFDKITYHPGREVR
jgi:hypothetical protein